MQSESDTRSKWRFWRWARRRKKESIQSNSEPPDVALAARKSTAFERMEVASAVLVVVAILTEDWDILPMAIHPTSKEGIKAIAGIAVAVFIALEILFSQLAKKHDGVVRNWYAKRVAELNLKAELERTARLKLEKEVAWRRLTPEQKTLVRDRLRGRSGQRVYLVPGIPGPEARGLTRSLSAALGGANWIPETDVSKPKQTSEIPGICVMVAGDNRARDAAIELTAVLDEMGFHPQLRDDFAIFVYQSYWPQELVYLSSSQQMRDFVLVVVLDKPEPAV